MDLLIPQKSLKQYEMLLNVICGRRSHKQSLSPVSTWLQLCVCYLITTERTAVLSNTDLLQQSEAPVPEQTKQHEIHLVTRSQLAVGHMKCSQKAIHRGNTLQSLFKKVFTHFSLRRVKEA